MMLSGGSAKGNAVLRRLLLGHGVGENSDVWTCLGKVYV